MSNRRRKTDPKRDLAAENFAAGLLAVSRHPVFSGLEAHAQIPRDKHGNLCPKDGWAVVTTNGYIHVHPTRIATPREWVDVLAHCLLHLGFGHIQPKERFQEWNAACDCYVVKFLADLKLGIHGPIELPARTEDRLYEIFCEDGIQPHLAQLGTAGPGAIDMLVAAERPRYLGRPVDWQGCFGQGLAAAVASAINVAAGVEAHLGATSHLMTPAQQARRWFISSYPLLGALAASFTIIEDPKVCQRFDISVAAVDEELQEIYMNPAAGMDELECRFVMAHELLHVGLRHAGRRQGRDHFLWNVACDYVINGWLVEMGVGVLPKLGVLYDPELKGESAEAIYDRIVCDLRRCRRLCTFRGVGIGDMLDGRGFRTGGDAATLDDFYRSCLGQGLEYYCGRGLLPAGLIEEIRALSQPPIPWDVELAHWFDRFFPPVEKHRSYARPSRRQSSTPDIPRPRWVPPPDSVLGRTFGVLLDTSGSMEPAMLAKALGAIASYSIARDVPAVRLVFCDAVTYDEGYVSPEDIAGRVKVRGRGGTILQPGVDLLERAPDFPKDGPLLIITDGFCDRLHIRREHAFLMPQSHHLPFVPRGEVFRMK